VAHISRLELPAERLLNHGKRYSHTGYSRHVGAAPGPLRSSPLLRGLLSTSGRCFSYRTKSAGRGFDVDLYGTVETLQLPLYQSEEGRKAVDYFESVAREIESKVGQHCTVGIIPCSDSLILDTQHHFRPEAMFRIRISHDRGIYQPEGPAEEQAIAAHPENAA
jgi:hypothetical protein